LKSIPHHELSKVESAWSSVAQCKLKQSIARKGLLTSPIRIAKNRMLQTHSVNYALYWLYINFSVTFAIFKGSWHDHFGK